MRQELYQYSISLKKRTENLGNTNTAVGNVCMFVLVALFGVFTAFLNIWISLIIIVSYTALFVYNRREKDRYAKILFDLGLFIFYLSLEMSVLFNSQPSFIGIFLIALFICLVFYEIKVYLSLKHKKYSLKNAKKNSALVAILGTLTLLCGSIGLKLGKSIGRNDRGSEEVIWLGAIIVSLLFVVSISYLQKYTVYKVLERKRNSVE